MATGTMKNLIAPTSLAFTLGTGVTNSNNRTRIFRIGDVIYAFIVAQYNTAITSQATAVTLLTINDTSVRPSLQVFAPAHTSSTGCMGNMQINSGGQIQFSINDGTKTFSANSIVYGELVWIVGK